MNSTSNCPVVINPNEINNFIETKLNETECFIPEKNEETEHKPRKLRRSYTFEEKLHILQKFDRESISSVCKEFGINSSILRSWRQQRSQIEIICRNELTRHSRKNPGLSCLQFKDPVMFCQIEMDNAPDNQTQNHNSSIDRKIPNVEIPNGVMPINLGDGSPVNYNGFVEVPDRSRKNYTFQEKLQALRRLDAEPTINICKELNINERTLRDWKKRRDEIERSCKSGVTENFKRLRNPYNQELEDILEAWVIQMREKGVVLTDTDLKQRALTFNQQLGGNHDFKASCGWLARWKHRKGYKNMK